MKTITSALFATISLATCWTAYGQAVPDAALPGQPQPAPLGTLLDTNTFLASQRFHPSEPDKPVTYLGVEIGPVPDSVREHLALPPGFGLLVENVVPDSPAAKAGIARHDILVWFNDQRLAAPEQLAALVRNSADGEQVALTLLRKGREEKSTVKLEQRTLPRWPVKPIFKLERQIQQGTQDALRAAEEARRKAEEAAERLRKMYPQTFEWQRKKPGATPKSGTIKPEQEEQKEKSHSTSSAVTSSSMQMQMADESGRIQLTVKDGKRTLRIEDKDGMALFDGPYEDARSLKSLPPEWREKVELLQKRGTLPPPDPQKFELKINPPPPLPDAPRGTI